MRVKIKFRLAPPGGNHDLVHSYVHNTLKSSLHRQNLVGEIENSVYALALKAFNSKLSYDSVLTKVLLHKDYFDVKKQITIKMKERPAMSHINNYKIANNLVINKMTSFSNLYHLMLQN